jgi:arabinoxylan arabinofuranohydrolase
MRWGNNHTHIHEYKGTKYILHHTLLLEELQGGTAGFRSIMVDYLPMDTKTGKIPITAASKKGVSQIKTLDAYSLHGATTAFTSADISYEQLDNSGSVAVKGNSDGSWLFVKGADFGYGAKAFTSRVKGKGRIEVRLDDIASIAVAAIDVDNTEYEKLSTTDIQDFNGRNHNIYFVFSKDVFMENWQFVQDAIPLRAEEPISQAGDNYLSIVFSAQAENPGPSPSAILELAKDGNYFVTSSSFAAHSEVLNLGFINTDANASYRVFVKSLSLATAKGMVEIPVNVELDPTSSSANGLANGWRPAAIGDLVYGEESKGLFAAETTIDWIGYRFALVVNGKEVPFTSISYKVSVTGFSH